MGTPQTCVLPSYHQSSHSNKSRVLSKSFRGTWKDLKTTLAPSQCGLHYWEDGHVHFTELLSHAVWYHGHSSFQFLEGERSWEKDETLPRAQTLFSHSVSVSGYLCSGCSTGGYEPGSLAAEAVDYRCSNTLYFAPSFMDDSTSREEERGKDVWDLWFLVPLWRYSCWMLCLWAILFPFYYIHITCLVRISGLLAWPSLFSSNLWNKCIL